MDVTNPHGVFNRERKRQLAALEFNGDLVGGRHGASAAVQELGFHSSSTPVDESKHKWS